jgi:5-methylcytosine-specific restriction enzyme subunit McrC
MAVIQVVEHERLMISDQPDASVKSISSVQAEALDKIQHTLPPQALEWGRDSVKFSQFCGSIAIGQDCIEVLPKIYRKEADYGVCREVLIKMLYAAKWLKTRKGGSGTINLQKHRLLDIFILQFCEEVLVQLQQGMIKRYIRQTDNLPVLRGKLLIDRQLKINLAHKERVYCQYDDLITDNPHNQVIKYVLKMLLKVAYVGFARKRLTELLYNFEAVQDRSFVKADVEKLPLDRSISRFAYVFEQCEWFLAGLSPDIFAGEQQSLVLLFDMNRLFEEVVAQKLKKMAWQSGYRIRTQGPQKYLLQDEATEQKVFMLKPDITLFDNENKIKAILDTKWKLLDVTDHKKNISQADLYQMISYAVCYQCKELHLLYPAHTEFSCNNRQRFSVSDTEIHITIHALDLYQLTKSDEIKSWREIICVNQR